jgi:transposase InsO family protein
MVRELRARGFPASKTWVERLMREHGIRGRRDKATTDAKHGLPVAENLLARDSRLHLPRPVFERLDQHSAGRKAGRMNPSFGRRKTEGTSKPRRCP